MESFRLDSLAPSVAERFRLASSIKRRRAVLLVCEYVVNAVGLTNDEARLALVKLREAMKDLALGSRLATLASEHDEEYFRLAALDEPGKARDILHHFSFARAMTALSLAMSADEDELHESIYEAMTALDDPSEVVSLVDAALS